MIGIITKAISDTYTVKYKSNYYDCKARGKFRNDGISPLVGDKVEFDDKEKVINKIFKRKNELVRPPVSNIDQALIVVSVKKPNFSPNFLDKLLIITSYNNVKPIICLTKLDLLSHREKKEVKEYIKYYRKIGYKVYISKERFKIKRIFKNKITVLAGQSGAGKSTLLNALSKKLNLKTGEISEALGRGKHTTRHVELFTLYKGLVADTPGFSALDFSGMSKEDVRDNIPEFEKYKTGCEYKDCSHLKEQNCKIKEMVKEGKILKSRYENYQKFVISK